MTPEDLLTEFKTKVAIAKFFGCAPQTVNEWFVAGEVPAGRQYEAQVKTAGKLLACSCKDK